MVLHSDDIKEEFEVTTLIDFLNKVGFKEDLQKKYPKVDLESGDIYEHISSDEETIAELLDEDSRLWTMTFIEDRHDGYWIIRQLNKLAEITIPISECDVQEMQDEDWEADWCFDFVDVHLTRQEEDDEVDDNA